MVWLNGTQLSVIVSTAVVGRSIVAETPVGKAVSVLDLFVSAGLCASKKEARRLIQQGGAKIDDQAVKNENAVIGSGDLKGDSLKLSAGKKRHALVKIT